MRTFLVKTAGKLTVRKERKTGRRYPADFEAVFGVYSACEYVYNGSACTVGRHANLGCWQNARKGLATTYQDHS